MKLHSSKFMVQLLAARLNMHEHARTYGWPWRACPSLCSLSRVTELGTMYDSLPGGMPTMEIIGLQAVCWILHFTWRSLASQFWIIKLNSPSIWRPRWLSDH